MLWSCFVFFLLLFFFPLNESFILSEFEIAVNVVFFLSLLSPPKEKLCPGNTEEKTAGVSVADSSTHTHWLNCNRFPQNVRKRWGPVPFNVRQMRPEGRGLCYHSYVTECGEWQGGARSLIGVNTCGAERGAESPRQCPVNASQERRSTGFEGKQLYLLTEMDFFFLFLGGGVYKALQQAGEWWEARSSEEIKKTKKKQKTITWAHTNQDQPTQRLSGEKRKSWADKNWFYWLINQSLWSISLWIAFVG